LQTIGDAPLPLCEGSCLGKASEILHSSLKTDHSGSAFTLGKLLISDADQCKAEQANIHRLVLRMGHNSLRNLNRSAVGAQCLGPIPRMDFKVANTSVAGRQGTEHLQVVGSGLDESVEQINGFAVTGERSGSVTKVRTCSRRALHVAQLDIGLCQIQLQIRVAARFCSQAVQVFETRGNQQLPSLGGASQRLNGIVHVEHEGIGQLAHLLETRFGAPRLVG
jgi:hypothetical protein